MKKTRTYTLKARAESVEATRQRIVDSLLELTRDRMFPDVTLEEIAAGAGVSVQTLLRQFGSRAALIDAAIPQVIEKVRHERDTPMGDVDAAVAVLMEHYEDRGDTAMLMLAQEKSDLQVGRITELGRQMHREWVRSVFAPFDPAGELTDLLVVATDVYTWKLLRRDRRMSRRATEEQMRLLVRAVLAVDPK